MHTHAHTITTGGDEMNVRQQEDYTGNQPSTAKKKMGGKLQRRCQSSLYVK